MLLSSCSPESSGKTLVCERVKSNAALFVAERIEAGRHDVPISQNVKDFVAQYMSDGNKRLNLDEVAIVVAEDRDDIKELLGLPIPLELIFPGNTRGIALGRTIIFDGSNERVQVLAGIIEGTAVERIKGGGLLIHELTHAIQHLRTGDQRTEDFCEGEFASDDPYPYNLSDHKDLGSFETEQASRIVQLSFLCINNLDIRSHSDNVEQASCSDHLDLLTNSRGLRQMSYLHQGE